MLQHTEQAGCTLWSVVFTAPSPHCSRRLFPPKLHFRDSFARCSITVYSWGLIMSEGAGYGILERIYTSSLPRTLNSIIPSKIICTQGN